MTTMPTKTPQQIAAEIDEMSRQMDIMSRNLARLAEILNGKGTR